jgi:molecular chaperone GrpE (heat shock protein)
MVEDITTKDDELFGAFSGDRCCGIWWTNHETAKAEADAEDAEWDEEEYEYEAESGGETNDECDNECLKPVSDADRWCADVVNLARWNGASAPDADQLGSEHFRAYAAEILDDLEKAIDMTYSGALNIDRVAFLSEVQRLRKQIADIQTGW